jgi:hypothetical protein
VGKNRDKKIVICKINDTKGKKTVTTTKCSISLAKVLDLFHWCPILVLMLSILGLVGKDAAPLFGQLEGKMAVVFFYSAFLALMGHLLQAGALKCSHQMTGL